MGYVYMGLENPDRPVQHEQHFTSSALSSTSKTPAFSRSPCSRTRRN